jgi:hypothetical protein
MGLTGVPELGLLALEGPVLGSLGMDWPVEEMLVMSLSMAKLVGVMECLVAWQLAPSRARTSAVAVRGRPTWRGPRVPRQP